MSDPVDEWFDDLKKMKDKLYSLDNEYIQTGKDMEELKDLYQTTKSTEERKKMKVTGKELTAHKEKLSKELTALVTEYSESVHAVHNFLSARQAVIDQELRWQG